MQLYFAPFACSLASHITLREAGLDADLVPVTLASKTTAAGDDFFAITAKGQVPALRLDDGTVLTEGPAVLQYLADQKPAVGLIPPVGSRDRYAVIEWVTFVGTEIHKACFAPMFNPEAPAEAKAWAKSLLERKLAFVASSVAGRSFLVGSRFTIADAYLGWALNLCGMVGVALPPALVPYLDAFKARPAVAAALAAEGAAAQAAKA